MLQLLVLFLRLVKSKRVKFGKWAELETIIKEIDKVVKNDITKFSNLVITYISTTLLIPVVVLEKLPWIITLSLYNFARDINTPSKIPLLISHKEKDSCVPWDYVGRDWNYYSHLLAKTYGWELQYIAGLDVDVALAHIQEILVDEQISREFLWSMSEIAYPYNSSTKTSKFSPLPRPYFMWEEVKPIKKVKILRSLLPSGVIVDSGGMGAYFEKEKSKETNPAKNN